MLLNSSETAFLEALAIANRSWADEAKKALSSSGKVEWSEVSTCWKKISEELKSTKSQHAFCEVLKEILSGLTHSFLVALDGGSILAESTTLTLQDSHGVTFKNHLHEYWPDFSEPRQAPND